MTAARSALRTLLLVPLAIGLASCGGDAPPPPAGQPAAQPPAPAAAPAPPSAAAPAPVVTIPGAQTDLVSARFVQVSEQGFPEVELTNLTARDIETISGSFVASNAEGKQVWGTGLTVAVPGQTFLAAGQSRVATPFGLNKKPEMMEILRSDPDSLTFSFAVREITYRGE